MRSARNALRLAAALVSLACALALASGSATAATPTGAFEVFKQCPVSNSSVEGCIYSETTGGEVTLGNTTVPIKHPIVLQGGEYFNETSSKTQFVAAANGETLSKSPQAVPGGLAALIKCEEILNSVERALCELAFENGLTGVNVTTELAQPASDIELSSNNLVSSTGTALKLPVKFHLENPLLGSECYIGSSSEPVIWNLTTGTTSPPPPNGPISGSPGEIELVEHEEILSDQGFKLVDNAFASPGVSGCGGALSSVLDPLIDLKLALPAGAGKNTAILTGSIEIAAAEAVKNHS